MSIKYIVSILVVLVIGVGLGFSIGTKQGIEQNKRESEAKISELNKTLDFFVPPPPAEVFSVLGEIKSISGNAISLEIISPSERNLPGTEPKKEMRIITVSQDTKIVKFDPFIMHTIDPKTKLPMPPKIESIKLSDLKAGDRITASAKENIKDKSSFEASEIQLQVLP